MSLTCLIYGLGVTVNVPLGGLAGLPATDRVDVYLTIGEMPPEYRSENESESHEYYVSAHIDEQGNPGLRAYLPPGAKYHRIVYSDGTKVLVSIDGARVWAIGPEGATVEDTATYLLGPILGFVLRLRGVTCLHASAVAIDGHAVALVGPSGAGKSSTAAAFAGLGYPVLSDDVVALAERGHGFLVQPAYPRVRLWEDSVAAMFGTNDALPRLTPTWDKRYLDLNGPGYRFQFDPLPLSAIYFLSPRSDETDTPKIEPMNVRDGLMGLVAESYVSYLLDPARRAQEFGHLTRLATGVSMRRVTPGTELAKISQLCRAIVGDFARECGQASG